MTTKASQVFKFSKFRILGLFHRASAGFAEVRAQLLRTSSALDTARLPLGLTGISASVSSLLGQLLLARPQLSIVGSLLRV